MSWEIVLGIIALVGFFITVGTPVLKLNTSIIHLNESVNSLRDLINKNELNSKEAHQIIWTHMDGMDNTIKDHEERITKAEASLSSQGEKIGQIEVETASQEHRIVVMETQMTHHEQDIKNNTNRLNKS